MNIDKNLTFYIHNFGDFIIINRAKYASRLLNIFYHLWLKEKLPNNQLLINYKNTFNIEFAFTNQFNSSVHSKPHLGYDDNLFYGNLTDYILSIIREGVSYRKGDLVELVNFVETHHKKTVQIIEDVWNKKQVDTPIYIVYRNPYKHFRSGLLQDTSWAVYDENNQHTELPINEIFNMFDVELSDSESGFVGNHRGQYLCFLMPYFDYLDNLNLINLDGTLPFNFENLFKKHNLDIYPNPEEKNSTHELSGGYTEHEIRERSSNRMGYLYVDEYVEQNDIVQRRIGEVYSADFIWYNKLKIDKRNIVI